MLNYHLLRSEVKNSLLQLWQLIDLSIDSLAWAWIAEILTDKGGASGIVQQQMLDQADRWLGNDDAWENDVNLPGTCLLCGSIRSPVTAPCDSRIPELIQRIGQLAENTSHKFSRFNDPDFAFAVAKGVGTTLSSDVQEHLRKHCEQNAASGDWRRRLMFTAASAQLGGSPRPVALDAPVALVHELPVILWFVEQFPNLVDGEERKRLAWKTFAGAVDEISWSHSGEDANGKYAASPIDMAMVYAALSRQVAAIDPVTLFDNIPWHSEIVRVSRNPFTRGESVTAVLQAGIALIDQIKHKANNPVDKNGNPLDGVNLVTNVFGSKTPILKFNALLSQADQNEHRGLTCIAEGIVSAYRNPKAHIPHASIQLTPYEAIEQLATISYLMRRVDSAQ